MPMNGLLTLADVADQFHRGAEQGLQYAEADRQKKQRDLYDQAGQAASKYIDGLRAQHILNGGAPEAFKPSSADVLKASEEFGKHLYKGGDFKGFLNNEVNVAPLRLRAISDSWRQYQLDKDPAKLAQAVLAIGGQEVEGVEVLPGGAPAQRGTAPTVAPPAGPNMATRQGMEQGLAALDAANTNPLGAQQPPVQPGLEGIVIPGKPGDGRLGAPSGPAKLRIRLAGGKVQMMDPATLERDVMDSLANPVQTAEELTKLRFATMTQRMKTQEALAVEREKGGQARQTEALRTKGRLTLADAQAGAAKEVAKIGAEGRVQAAQIGATSREAVAETRGAAGGGARGGGANSVQSRSVDQDGYVVLNFKDGTSKRATVDGKPVRSQDWSKRVDSMAKEMAKTMGGMNKPMDALRKEAEQMLMGAPPPVQAPAAGGKDYSNLWSK